MALYPIKVLLDKDKKVFIPFLPANAIPINGTDETVAGALENRYTKNEVDNIIKSLGTIQVLKGRVDTYEDLLAIENPRAGDVYIVGTSDTENSEYMYIGNTWERLGPMVDLSGYYTKEEVDTLIAEIPTPDLSGYYNKTETDAKIDEKIAGIPINDLLHYKGHVNTIEELPSLGQASGTYIAPSYDYIRTAMEMDEYFLNGNKVYVDYGKARAKYYIVIGGFGNSNNHRYRPFVIYTDYPEMIKICFINYNRYTIPTLKITYNSAKPVFISFSTNSTYATKEEYLNANAQQITSNTVVNCIIQGGYANYAGWDSAGGGFRCIEHTNIPQLVLDTVYDSNYTQFWTDETWWQESNVLQSMCDFDNNYIWTNGMNIITHDDKDWSKLIYSESLADLNDMYTVGNNYDVYRRNELPEWEHWSQNNGYSKEEIDTMFGTAEAALDTIIDGGV